MNGTFERLDSAERWLRAGLEVCGRAGGLATLEVDLTETEKIRGAFRRNGTRVSFIHMLTKATALVLARDQSLHQHVNGGTRWRPERVHVGISVAGDYVISPMVIIKDAAKLSVQQIGEKLHAKAKVAREEQETLMIASRRWGWTVPFAFMRRFILKKVIRYTQFGNEDAPTVQLTCLRGLRMVTPLLLGTMAAIGAGGMEDRVVVVNGKPTVRPMITLCASMDHKVWNGLQVESFLLDIKRVLESDALWADVPDTKNTSHASPQKANASCLKATS